MEWRPESPVNARLVPAEQHFVWLEGSDHSIIGGWGVGRLFFSAGYFFQLMLKLDFLFHAPFEAKFFFHKELKVRLFF